MTSNIDKTPDQSPRKGIKDQHERASIEDVLHILNQKHKTNFSVIDRPEPPDAVISDGTIFSWIEHADAFRDGDEAHELFSHVTPGERKHPIKNIVMQEPDEKMAMSILRNLENKLGKKSYEPIFRKHGAGILILTEQDPLFSDRTFNRLEQDLEGFHLDIKTSIVDQGYFKSVYLRFRCSGWASYGLVQIYPTWNLIHIPDNFLSKT